jgi:hypothetical protein
MNQSLLYEIYKRLLCWAIMSGGNNQNNNVTEFKRGRGRPKKNQTVNNNEKKKKMNDNVILNVHIKEASLSKPKDEIILHFPFISLNDISYKNTPKKEPKNNPHDIFTINDGTTSTKSESDCLSENNNVNYIELIQQLESQK